MGGDARVPRLTVQNYGYLYLADTPAFADHAARQSRGPARLRRRHPAADRRPRSPPPIRSTSSTTSSWARSTPVDEGYWDGGTVFEWFRRKARDNGAEYIAGEVVAMTRSGGRIDSVTLASGEVIACGHVVNASGPRAARTAAMAGIELPVEPRKRFSWVFTAETPARPRAAADHRPLGRPCPPGRPRPPTSPAASPTPTPPRLRRFRDGPRALGGFRLAACSPPASRPSSGSGWSPNGPATTPITLSTRTPSAGRIRRSRNFLFLNGFSGHGLQQSPAMGRGTAEWIIHGDYRSLDLRPFWFDRIARGPRRCWKPQSSDGDA